MRKLNATLLNGTNKEDAILKIKDESFSIDTNEQIIKIAYSNVKSYEYDDSEEILTIVKYGGNPIKLNIVKDRQLLELLSNLVIQNKNNKQKVEDAIDRKNVIDTFGEAVGLKYKAISRMLTIKQQINEELKMTDGR